MNSTILTIADEILFFINFVFVFFLSFLVQKVIFLEETSKKTDKISNIIAFVSPLMYLLVKYAGKYFFSDNNLFWYAQYFMVFVPLYITLVIRGFNGRKKAKWLAIFEPIPVYGLYFGFNAFLTPISTLITDSYGLLVSDLFYVAIYVGLMLTIIILKKKRIKLFVDLEKDIKNRSLSTFEAILVWAVGLWQMFSLDLLNIDSTASNKIYINTLNFILCIVILIFVIMSNYRDYYSKKSTLLQKSLITTMADLVESRDDNTGGHIHRTSMYVEIIAKRLKKDKKFKDILTDKYIEHMIIAAPLHDVGKIHIPDSVLNKPGRLDDDEFAIMKSHAKEGEEIIKHVEESVGDTEYLSIAKEMAAFHHERMDGKGYPYGLKDKDIPLCAKILAVADVFDALSSKRCYKDAMPLDKAFSIIEEEIGDHFDPVVAKAFMDSRDEVEQILNS